MEITTATLERVMLALSNHWFSEDGEYNNYDVIEAETLLKEEIAIQEGR